MLYMLLCYDSHLPQEQLRLTGNRQTAQVSKVMMKWEEGRVTQPERLHTNPYTMETSQTQQAAMETGEGRMVT